VWHLGELRGVEVTSDHVTLGALTTYTEVQRHEVLRREFPALCEAARETGGWAIQNRGTIGGNIANASPAADSPPALLAYDAEIELVSSNGARWVGYDEFHTGYKQTAMRADELIARVRLPRARGDLRSYYRKVGTRRAQAISKVCLAATASTSDGRLESVRVAVGSVAPTVVRCRRTEELLRGRKVGEVPTKSARETLSQEIAPIDDIRSTRDYRLRVAANLLEEFLSSLR
ncbi:MAG: xanthine dehydrogenase family protein subunit M, partial [Acidobacteria bacterium]|nr:xanthine dehydrogenase family protein subunit M [Acidobacteriota bacterium]MCA1642029.1 xanthine dehydrogenase family protein subunit M [Acidobacteriota bacterium]